MNDIHLMRDNSTYCESKLKCVPGFPDLPELINVGYPIYSMGNHAKAFVVGQYIGRAVGLYITEYFKGREHHFKVNIIFTGSSGVFVATSALPEINQCLKIMFDWDDDTIYKCLIDQFRYVYIAKPDEKRHDIIGQFDFVSGDEVLNIIVDDLMESGSTVQRIISKLPKYSIGKVNAVFCQRADSDYRMQSNQTEPITVFTLK